MLLLYSPHIYKFPPFFPMCCKSFHKSCIAVFTGMRTTDIGIDHIIACRQIGPRQIILRVYSLHCDIHLLNHTSMKITFVYFFVQIKNIFIPLKPDKFPVDFTVIMIVALRIDLRSPIGKFFRNLQQRLFQKPAVKVTPYDPASIIHAPNRGVIVPYRFLAGKLFTTQIGIIVFIFVFCITEIIRFHPRRLYFVFIDRICFLFCRDQKGNCLIDVDVRTPAQ